MTPWALARSVWARRHSAESALLAANLAARLLGFVVSLALSRWVGVQALGVYSGLLISTASPTTPMSVALANNVTVLSAREGHRHSPHALLRAQATVSAWALLSAGLGCALMLHLAGWQGSAGLSNGVLLGVAAGLVLGQGLTQLAGGLWHGLGRSRQVALWTLWITLLALCTTAPVLWAWGLPGLLWQAVAVAVLPGLWMAWQAWKQAAPLDDAAPSRKQLGVHSDAALTDETLPEQAMGQLRQALPHVAATVLNNACNWVSCIYLAQVFHGSAGVGLVAIGLQWMALMQLPLTSWGGRVLQALAVAHRSSPEAFVREVLSQRRRCAQVSVLAAVGVCVLAYGVAWLYRVDPLQTVALFAINGVAVAVGSLGFVGERMAYCLGTQRRWLWLSLMAYVLQMGVTLLLIRQSILAVAWGNLAAACVLAFGARLPGLPATKSGTQAREASA